LPFRDLSLSSSERSEESQRLPAAEYRAVLKITLLATLQANLLTLNDSYTYNEFKVEQKPPYGLRGLEPEENKKRRESRWTMR
jgi:hypothetical protein